jgi:IclR family transcriptional regulator, acetate operon repressor
VSDGEAPRGTLGTIRNASVLLDLLSEGPAYHQLSDLADRSQLSLPTVHRLLRSLMAAGLVQQDPASSRYGLGPELVRLSERYLDRLPLLHSLRPYLVDLRNRTRVTVQVAIRVRDRVVYVERIDGADSVQLQRSGRTVPVASVAAGRLVAGHAGPEAWKQLVELDEDLTFDQLEEWAHADHLVADIDGPRGYVEVAVPLRFTDGPEAAALSAIGGPPTFTRDQLIAEVLPELQQTAALVERMAGRVG